MEISGGFRLWKPCRAVGTLKGFCSDLTLTNSWKALSTTSPTPFSMQSTRALAFSSSLFRQYAPKYPRPRPGTSERPAYHAKDPLVNNPNAAVTNLEDENLTFIHRPPPTAPSPYSLTTAPLSPLLRPPSAPYDGPLPPLTRTPAKPPKDLLTDAQLKELRELRYSDPRTYTRGKLAKMFKCTQSFVGQVAALKKPERKRVLSIRDKKHQAAREQWSERHSIVKAISKKRRELW